MSIIISRIRNYIDLNEYITGRVEVESKTYILLDEVQMVFEWERAVNSLRLDNFGEYRIP